jgi:hypothetical protein
MAAIAHQYGTCSLRDVRTVPFLHYYISIKIKNIVAPLLPFVF